METAECNALRLLLKSGLVVRAAYRHGRLELDEGVRLALTMVYRRLRSNMWPTMDALTSHTINFAANDETTVAEFSLHGAAPLYIGVNVSAPA